jgi:2-polyprenyl-6-methoxyphenol hydroxylase-like FAD-dependent oxidoreductase
MSDSSRHSPKPVLVVGAGPTGLTLAAALTRYGVPVRLVEKKTRLSRHTKATNLMQRNQEVLSALGLLEPVAAVGGQMRRLMVHSYGQCFGPRTMRLDDTPFRDVLLCGQHNLEAVVAAGLMRRGVPVEFGTELEHLRQSAEGVTATLRTAGGVEALDCGYVVGCDGGAGVTRTFTKLNFRPHRTGVAIRQVDCKLAWRRLPSMTQMWLFYFTHGFAAIVPLPGGVHRVLFIEPKDAFPAREPTLDEMQAKLRDVTGDDSATISDIDWFSYTDLQMGIAPGLRDGRVLLAGDAGNPILPNGGQGMNAGISDAFNLGWKLSSVVLHGGTPELLDAYDRERHALRVSLEKAQWNSLKYTTLVTPRWVRAVFRLVAEPLLNWGVERVLARAFSQLGVHTRRSDLTLERGGRRGLRAGDRVLDAEVVGGRGQVSLFDLLYAGGWTLLAFTGTRTRDHRRVLAAVAVVRRADIPSYVVSTDAAIETGLPTLYDLDEIAHRVYRVTRPVLYLVRPDGHVGARVRPSTALALQAYARRWIPEGALAPVS